MPEMDGLVATDHIRQTSPHVRQPFIVALTANAMASEKEHYLTSGMDGYLSKPIEISELKNCLRRAIEFRTENS